MGEWLGYCLAGVIFVFALVFLLFSGVLLISIAECFTGDFSFSLVKGFCDLICSLGEFVVDSESAGFFTGVLCLAAIGAVIGSFLWAYQS